MRRTFSSIAVVGLSASLTLAACESADEGGGLDGLVGDTTGDGDSETGDGNEGDGDGDTGNTDPVGCNAESPYMAGWDIGCCQDEIVQNGWSPGAVYAGTIMPDWTLMNQFGEDTRLYDFCHEAVYFEYVALW
ncbi:hypothetical protein [Enhygromyxa salina]|uniref:Dipeptide-binding ABC transporter, periplasmic substrate-binding component n=1 Tax=Enhygromyxa salina TaxID=215803 RepID=A0A2S9YVW6_9BACT|nr:hypothetical protein [Enhygromyxa salina]PRQ09248.1 hypothetical protein ENSA7_12380 [Enhygromyxa salina]